MLMILSSILRTKFNNKTILNYPAFFVVIDFSFFKKYIHLKIEFFKK
jgi:hypothetical protein